MHVFFVAALAMLHTTNYTLFNFNNEAAIKGWRVVDDVVMGGRSSGHIEWTEDGHAHYFGSVSLENNGGFSSVRKRFETLNTSNYSTVVLRVKGDGKKYQFRLKTASQDYYAYVFSFPTSGQWETIEIPFNQFYPSWRGQKLDRPNYAAGELEEVAFLIANYKNEDFDLLIEKVELK